MKRLLGERDSIIFGVARRARRLVYEAASSASLTSSMVSCGPARS